MYVIRCLQARSPAEQAAAKALDAAADALAQMEKQAADKKKNTEVKCQCCCG